MDGSDDPTGRDLMPWQDLGADTRPTCSPPRTPVRTTIPRAIHEIVGELKVRFQHTSGGDPEGFKARAALLAEDLADAPAMLLRRAAVAWAREQPFFPTAADLVRTMREQLEAADHAAAKERAAPPPGYDPARAFCDQRNSDLRAGRRPAGPDGKPRTDTEWHVMAGGECKLRYLQPGPYDPGDPDRCDPREVDRLNWGLRYGKAAFRFDRDGRPFGLAPGANDLTIPAAGPYRAGGNGYDDEPKEHGR